jgi:hypothetical protein
MVSWFHGFIGLHPILTYSALSGLYAIDIISPERAQYVRIG